MSTPFFVMRNHHGADSGEPPVFRNDTGSKYLGYFENAFGEQWVFVFDRELKKAELVGGDAGWQNSFAVVDGHAQDVVLGTLEIDWLRACWRAATGAK